MLSSILSQNPKLYASPNSALVELLVNVRQHLSVTEQARAFMQPTQTVDVLRHIMEGMYHFTDKPYILDKSRAWPHPLNIELLTEVLQKRPKFIATVRDLPSVLASFIALIEKQEAGTSYVDVALRQAGLPFTTQNRCETLFSPGGTVYESWHSLQMAFADGYQDLFYVLEYDDFISRPAAILNEIYDFLELPRFTHDLTHIENRTPEDDRVYNIAGLHAIRPTVAKTARPPELVLGERIAAAYAAVPHFWRNQAPLYSTKATANPFVFTIKDQ